MSMVSFLLHCMLPPGPIGSRQASMPHGQVCLKNAPVLHVLKER